MEEQVGKVWDRLLGRGVRTGFSEAVVKLEDVARPVAMLFHALGGDPGLQIISSEPNFSPFHPGLLARLAGRQRNLTLAWRDETCLRLPREIHCFATAALNRELYLWLACLATRGSVGGGSWLTRSQCQTRSLLNAFPALATRYHRLVAAHLSQRPDPAGLDPARARQERIVRAALNEPGSVNRPMAGIENVTAPVPLWLHPNPAVTTNGVLQDQDEPATGTPARRAESDLAQKTGERVSDMPEGRGLLAIRMENIFSWAEFVAVDRDSEEEEDLDRNLDALRDLDRVSISRNPKRTATAIRVDLDLPPLAADDTVISEGMTLPEWNHRNHTLEPDRCRIIEMTSEARADGNLPPHLAAPARRLRRRFRQLAPARVRLRRQVEGPDIDLDALQQLVIDRRTTPGTTEERLYLNTVRGTRHLASLLMADLSLSTDAHVNDSQRVIEVIRDGLHLFSQALSACGDPFALYGFSSRRRDPVRIHRLKSFEEPPDALMRRRINAIKPGYYTRMGAAIRYAIRRLEEREESHRLLLLLTDGKPNDLDHYEGRAGIEDTRASVLEARRKGIQCFCVTIDQRAADYLPHLFGARNYVVVDDPVRLPSRLSAFYAMLTR